MSALSKAHSGQSRARARKPARPRDAASLVIYRRQKGETEVLMGRRASRHRFMPNIFVFPGGRVDVADWDVDLACDLAKPVARKLEDKWSARMARALAVAAVRETFEETGLVIGECHNGKIRPNLRSLDYVARAITPSDSPMRFHARFFSIDSKNTSGLPCDSEELQDLKWFSLGEALGMGVADVTEFVLGEIKQQSEGLKAPGVPLFSYRNGKAVVKYEA